MEKIQLNLAEINPYVRFVQHVTDVNSKNHYVPWRILYDFEIIYVVKGQIIVELENSTYVLDKKDFHIMPPFLKHTRSIAPNCDCEYYGVHLDFVYDSSTDFSVKEVYLKPCKEQLTEVPVDEKLANREILGMNKFDSMQKIRILDNANILSLFEKLSQAYDKSEITSIMKCKAIVLEIISQILDEANIGDRHYARYDEIIESFVEYISHNYMSEIDNLSLIAREYGLSPGHFRKVFKDKMKKTPLAFVIDCRIEEAKKLLRLQKYTISEISYMVGCDSINYFSRLFKQKENMAPKEYQNMFIAEDSINDESKNV